MSKGKLIDLTGKKFGKLIVINRAPDHLTPSGRKIIRWNCQCECGNMVVKNGEQIKRMKGVSCDKCSKKSPKPKNLLGVTFGSLKVIQKALPLIGADGRKRTRWTCQCNCGNTIDVLTEHLTRNLTKSCGCQKGNRSSKQNYYENKGDYYIGYTSKWEQFYIDSEDFEKVSKYYWHIDSAGYVCTKVKNKLVRLHRLILNTDAEHIDHINGKSTRNDNRKSNLRPCTHSENLCNRGLDSRNSSGAKGVSLTKSHKYSANITKSGKQYHLGTFNTLKEAADAYDNAAKKLHGEYAFLNDYQGGGLCD